MSAAAEHVPERHAGMTTANTGSGADPDWLASIRITTPEQRAYWGEKCNVCPAPAAYAIDLPMCREHALGGVCFTCGSPLSSFGRAAGDYVCEGLDQGIPESVWRHERGPYAHYERTS